ncbi:CBL-interacting serine/threonine-protein kinase 21-like isoform X4 [Phragmites australis]|uniref:CBL-interacting serine/threonine-protein kinase 21-like isoform X4 n=1 Tax=Phragmites australis TaxID=29695 RepID=UPI002D785558|nr:CBL-interacting serine/threonine-protein kinase 21-like isoform X4 [Phragmites australis]
MGFVESVGKYRLGRTVGEGTFAKVRLATGTETGGTAAVKIIDKEMVLKNKLMCQVKREISAMKLLNHPNIVKIYEVIATKTKICLVMEYVSGGQLSDKLSHLKRLDEREAKRYFHQLIDAVDYCHRVGVYHRDLKVILHKSYDGAAADVWSCGVILFELLAGYLPFQDRSLTNLYRMISRAQFSFPQWFTPLQKKLISRILNPSPIRRAKISDIFDDEWFQEKYNPSTMTGNDIDHSSDFEEVSSDSDSCHRTEVREAEELMAEPERLINAFRLIATCSDLDLSGLFQEQQKTKLSSPHPVQETLEKIKIAAQDVSLSVRRMDSSVVKLQDRRLLERSIPDLTLLAEVIEVTPVHCVVQVSKSTGDLRTYRKFCRSLSRLLNGEQQPGSSSDLEVSTSE